jgi:HSP90 family molecular chaperone
LVTPWESELLFDSYNKVEIKEIKNVKSKPLIEIKVKEDKKQQQLEAKTKEIEQKVVAESKKPVKSLKEKLLESVNEQVKKIQVDGKLNKEEKKELIKKLLSNEL